ncbi:MAG: hypothetical protein QOH73_176 [Gaiellaceae bacterium]|jgi:hypothetical protein|nr:hypothetical protein [Gaiellaceae bacterium]
MRTLAALILLAGAVGATPPSPNDHLLVLGKRVGPFYYHSSHESQSDYAAARTAFGRPTSQRVDGNLCRVTWKAAGITIGFASDARPCAPKTLAAHGLWYGMTLWAATWHNTRGLRIGMSTAAVRHLYPGASGNTHRLILATHRDQELTFVLLAVTLAQGKVVAIDVPADFVY